MKLSFRRAAPLTLICTTIVVIVAFAFISNRLFSNLTSAVEQNQFDLMRTIVQASLKAAEDKAMARAEMIANIPVIRGIFAQRDREKLLAQTMSMFEIQKAKYGVDQIQFHLAPATSFLRLHSPTQHSDDLSKFRPMVVAVNADKVARKGIVIARSGPAVFGVVPVYDTAGEHTGSLDVGMEFGPILDGLKSTYQMDLALFIAEEPLRKFATGLPGDVLVDQNRRGKFMKFHSTHWELMQKFCTEADVAKVSEASFTRQVQGVTYGVAVIPVLDTSGNALGLIFAAKDFSASRAASGRSFVWQCLLAFIAIVVLAVVIIVVIRGFVLRPMQVIGERFTALAEGDASRKIDQPETLCREMQDLASTYERLRSKEEGSQE